MKKIGTVCVIAAALMLVALPAVLGSMTEQRVRTRVDAMQTGSLTATLLSYERGWFSSRARIELRLSPGYLAEIEAKDRGITRPGNVAPDQTATIVVDFTHGPIAVHDGVFVGLSKMSARLDPEIDGVGALEQQLGIPYFFEFRGRSGFLGGVAFDADMPAIHVPLPDAALDFSGAVLTGALRGKRLTSDLALGSVTFQTPSGAFGLKNLAAKIAVEIRSRYVMPGTLAFTLEHVLIADAENDTAPLFELKNLEAESQVSLAPTGTELEMQTTYSIDALRAEGMTFADASLGIAFHKIDTRMLESYFENAARLSAGAAGSGRDDMLRDLSPILARGLAAGPSLELEPVRFTLNDEPFDAHVEVAVDPAVLPPAGAIDVEDPSLWLAIVKSKVRVSASKVLARQMAVLATQMQLASSLQLPPEQLRGVAEAQAGLVLATLTAQGMLQSDGDDYRAEIELADGLLSVNGRPLPRGLP